jgi:hypothetical protein
VSPDVVDPPTGAPVQLFQIPQKVALVCMTISIYPYGLDYGQDYGVFVTSSSNMGAVSVDYTQNLIIGYNYPARANLTGYNNTILGYQSGGMLTSGSNNTLIGFSTGYYLTIGQGNTIVGNLAGLLSTTGNYNTMLGNGAGFHITSGQYNVLIGNGACDIGTTASGNVCVGNATLENLTVGIDNTVIGNGAGNAFVADSSGCVAIGAGSAGGPGIVAVNSTYIGVGAVPSGNVTNETVIGTELTGKGSNTAVIGGAEGCYFYSPCLAAFYSSTIDSESSTIFWNGAIVRGMDPSTNYQYLNFKTQGIYEITLSGTLYTAAGGIAVVTFYKNGVQDSFGQLTLPVIGGPFLVSGSSMGVFNPGDSCYFLVSSNIVSDSTAQCYCNIKYVSMV